MNMEGSRMKTMLLFAALVTAASVPMIGAALIQTRPPAEVVAPDIQVSTPDREAGDAQRLGRSLIACRELRRRELDEMGHPEEGARYVGGLDLTYQRIRDTHGDRAEQKAILWEDYEACATAKDLADLHLSFTKIKVDYAGAPLEALMRSIKP